jgi:hypothetical protein
MFIAGSAWIMFISLMNVLILNYAPEWMRARVLAIATLVIQGAVAAGSATWGAVAAHNGLRAALLCAGIGTITTTTLALFWRLPSATVDLAAWNHWRLPTVQNGQLGRDGDSGPVLVTIEYEVAPRNVSDFLQARRFGPVRRRDGAIRWGIFRDLDNPDRYLETFVVSSWAEHLRQHERHTRADHEIEQRLRRYVRGDPAVRHLVSAAATIGTKTSFPTNCSRELVVIRELRLIPGIL